jgi:transmembrane sensor
MVSAELQLLLEQYLDGIISEQDFKRLWETLPKEEHNTDWYSAIEGIIAKRAHYGSSNHYQSHQALADIKARIGQQNLSSALSPHRTYRMFNNSSLFRVAAAILVIACTTAAIILTTSKINVVPEVVSAQKDIHNDVQPAAKIAMLKLSDGTTIDLENIGNGKIAQQGSMEIIKLANGELMYKSAGNIKDKKIIHGYNTVITPRGGQYQLLLPDGSKIWLNAESSITYPVVFTGNTREVKITGEVYFEVAKDKTKPFLVLAEDTKIEVLGTHFNVNAYSDGGPVKTSLLEGSVQINKHILNPGQAYLNGNIISTDVDQDVAWKNGVFNFNDQNLSQIMLQLARWYDLEVVFAEGVPNKQYAGEIGRNLNLSQVLKGLENSGVHFELQGKRLTVRHQ